jgi:hypothetical protein
MHQPTPGGITPPAPGLDREEPDLWVEDDIPSDDGKPAGRADRGEERGGEGSERE